MGGLICPTTIEFCMAGLGKTEGDDNNTYKPHL